MSVSSVFPNPRDLMVHVFFCRVVFFFFVTGRPSSLYLNRLESTPVHQQFLLFFFVVKVKEKKSPKSRFVIMISQKRQKKRSKKM